MMTMILVYNQLQYKYNNGTMCAWDEPTPNATIKTFDTLQAVYDANYSVVHCGACANCSNYPDMSLEYTTRYVQNNVIVAINYDGPVKRCTHMHTYRSDLSDSVFTFCLSFFFSAFSAITVCSFMINNIHY